MSLPDGVAYGIVRWRALVVVPDGSDLDNDEPDTQAVAGTVEFVPSVSRLLVSGATPPVTLFMQPQVFGIGSDGVLRDAEGRDRITLVSPTSPGISPQSWTWTAKFSLANGLVWEPIVFGLPPGAEIDLTMIAVAPG